MLELVELPGTSLNKSCVDSDIANMCKELEEVNSHFLYRRSPYASFSLSYLLFKIGSLFSVRKTNKYINSCTCAVRLLHIALTGHFGQLLKF